MRYLIIFAILSVSLESAHASNDYQNDAKRMWASYYCSALARMAADDEKQAQLIHAGTALGRSVIEAVAKGEADAYSMGKGAPPFIMTQTGVSTDFQLGSLWMSAENDAVSDLLKNATREPDDSLNIMESARKEFKIRNCDLL